MNQEYALIKTHPMKESINFSTPLSTVTVAHLDDPALTVMADFQQRPPYSTSMNTPIYEALQQMKLLAVKSLFVINAENQIVGHISTRDIQGNKATMLANQLDLKMVDMTVKQLMLPPEQLHILYFGELSNMRVGHIVRLLHELGVNYVFVIDEENGTKVVRGLFSISRISQQLGENVMSDLSSHSLIEMNRVFNFK